MNETFAAEKFPYLSLPKDFIAYYQPGKVALPFQCTSGQENRALMWGVVGVG